MQNRFDFAARRSPITAWFAVLFLAFFGGTFHTSHLQAQNAICPIVDESANEIPLMNATGRDSVRAWMLHLDAYEGDLALAKDYLTTGENTLALNVLDAAAAKYGLNTVQTADLAEIREIFVMVIDQAGVPHTAAQLDRLEEIAEHTESGYAYAMARNILTRYGAHYPPYFHLPGGERQARPDAKPKVGNKGFMVYPNPADDQVVFIWPNTQSLGNLVITDLTGKTALIAELQLGQTSLTWNTIPNASGVYFYRFQWNAKPAQSGKIIIRH